jgi:protein-tyrosine phosphatase
MKNPKLNWVRLPINTVENCRELGGYSTNFGQQTKWHTFLRSSEMSKLSREDIEFLKEYGVRTVIDLRGEDEIETRKNPLAEEVFCEYHNIPYITGKASDSDMTPSSSLVDLLKNNKSFKKIMDTIDQAGEGCIVFHCNGGNSRTGLLAMLLLCLAGVEKKDIVSNYEVSYTNLESLHQNDSLFGNIPKEHFYSSRDYILRAYEYILHTYQSVDQYLMAKGVEQDVIDRVKRRLLGLSETVLS